MLHWIGGVADGELTCLRMALTGTKTKLGLESDMLLEIDLYVVLDKRYREKYTATCHNALVIRCYNLRQLANTRNMQTLKNNFGRVTGYKPSNTHCKPMMNKKWLVLLYTYLFDGYFLHIYIYIYIYAYCIHVLVCTYIYIYIYMHIVYMY